MTRLGTLLQISASVIFVIAGIAYAYGGADPLVAPSDPLIGPALPSVVLSIPQIYLNPGNPLMWALLVTVWMMVLLDAVGQWLDPSDEPLSRAGRPRVWPLTTTAMLCAAAWPLMLDRPLLLTAATAISAICATVGARRAAGRHRPAVGFLAGWATAMTSAALAGLISDRFGLPLQAISALAILPGAAVGMAAQIWIGPSIGYSAALIWAFCALTVTTMGSDPMIALAAILGISAMAAVLVRAAS
ncbi:hypothetical protein E4191_02530 [Paracoccus liaowanqingii]|uniref:Uncharacterized protein n=2 Tax=Paracoccus liaowanqingii TaxID=2560053 RepID=A0A4P7HI39_9RHOB|nr:hypothetical protein [Paracoccus liaowanqingii]QBX33719.1 hypothetical protein E4191_02530 [Paracoccus liaowanqingii]